MPAMVEAAEIDALCRRLSGLPDLQLPTRRPESKAEGNEQKEFSMEEKCKELRQYFKSSPVKFLQRYHTLIAPKEISCFNQIPQCEEVGYYIKEICQRKNLESRTSLDRAFVPQEVKNRRFRAMQKMINEGNYFSDAEMEKRNPRLYEEYVGRFLSIQEREEKFENASASKPPPTLVSFFMEVIDRKEEAEAMDESDNDEEFDTDSDGEAEPSGISNEEKKYLEEEFRSRMYQNFLDGLDKDFIYKAVDENAEYDDFEQLGRDEQDAYFDEEEPALTTPREVETKDSSSEDELDRYMKTVNETMAAE